MPKDKTVNHGKIIAAAKKEFMTYGFKDASMRRIAADAGMSASGLYKHFPSKEDMFSALVEPAYSGLVALYKREADEQHVFLETADTSDLWTTSTENTWIMKYIYGNFDAFKLIVCRSEGTRYENFQHELAKLGEGSTLEFMAQLKEMGKELNDFSMKEFHLLTTACVDAIFQTVRHDFTEEEALHYAATLDTFYALSWKQFFGY